MQGLDNYGSIGNGMTVEGFEQFQKNIKELRGAWGSKESAEIVLKAAKVGRDIVRSKAARGKTGNLRKGIVAKKFSKQQKLNPTAFIAIDFSKAPHAHLIEYGHNIILGDWFPGVTPREVEKKRRRKTTNRFGKKFQKVGHVAAKPFFRPGIRAAQNPMFVAMAKGSERLLDKVRVRR